MRAGGIHCAELQRYCRASTGNFEEHGFLTGKNKGWARWVLIQKMCLLRFIGHKRKRRKKKKRTQNPSTASWKACNRVKYCSILFQELLLWECAYLEKSLQSTPVIQYSLWERENKQKQGDVQLGFRSAAGQGGGRLPKTNSITKEQADRRRVVGPQNFQRQQGIIHFLPKDTTSHSNLSISYL